MTDRVISSNTETAVNTNRVKILTLGSPNANGRIYTHKVAETIVKENLDALLGEFAPVGTSVNLQNVSHTISNLAIEGDGLYGDVHIMSTQAGRLLKELLTAEDNIGFRPRGTGFVSDDGVVSEYKLVAIDAVRDPA